MPVTSAQTQPFVAWQEGQSVLALHGQLVAGAVGTPPPAHSPEDVMQVPTPTAGVHQPHVAVPTHPLQVVCEGQTQAADVLIALPAQVPTPTQPGAPTKPLHHSQPLAAFAAHELQSALAVQLTVGHVVTGVPRPTHAAVVPQLVAPKKLQ